MERSQRDEEEVEMTDAEYLIYSARVGEIDDIMQCLEEKIDLNTSRDQTGNTALRKSSRLSNLFRHGMC